MVLHHQSQIILNDRLAYLQKRLPENPMDEQVIAGKAQDILSSCAYQVVIHIDIVLLSCFRV
jgi:hypothetical protein